MKRQDKIAFNGEVAEVELIYKSKVKASERVKIKSSDDAAIVFRHHWNKNTIELQEEMKVMYLNRAGHVLGLFTVSKGSITGTVVDCRLVLIAALRLGAVSCLICHSHPSGNIKPSKEDKAVTEKIKHAAALLDIQLIDHIILTADSHFSFASEGLL